MSTGISNQNQAQDQERRRELEAQLAIAVVEAEKLKFALANPSVSKLPAIENEVRGCIICSSSLV